MEPTTTTAHGERCENATSTHDLCGVCVAFYEEWLASEQDDWFGDC
jgi:hypothetical protein